MAQNSDPGNRNPSLYFALMRALLPHLDQRNSARSSPLQLLFNAFIFPLMTTSIALPFELHLGSCGLCLSPIVSQKYFLGMAFGTKHGIFFVFIRVFLLLPGGRRGSAHRKRGGC